MCPRITKTPPKLLQNCQKSRIFFGNACHFRNFFLIRARLRFFCEFSKILGKGKLPLLLLLLLLLLRWLPLLLPLLLRVLGDMHLLLAVPHRLLTIRHLLAVAHRRPHLHLLSVLLLLPPVAHLWNVLLPPCML